jgi:hypothetical protein
LKEKVFQLLNGEEIIKNKNLRKKISSFFYRKIIVKIIVIIAGKACLKNILLLDLYAP